RIMGLLHVFGQRSGHRLGVSGTGEAAHGYGHARLDQPCRVSGTHQAVGECTVVNSVVHGWSSLRSIRTTVWRIPAKHSIAVGGDDSSFRAPWKVRGRTARWKVVNLR